MGMTKQRRLIFDIVKNSRRHMTADEVYSEAKKEINNIGLGTVYRNLDFLRREGLVRRVELPDGPDRYDGNVTPHEHARCISCGRLLDVRLKTDELLEKGQLEGFEIFGCEVHIVGLCKECAEKKRREKNG